MALKFKYLEEFEAFKRKEDSEKTIEKIKQLIIREIKKERMQGVDDDILAMDLIDKAAELYVLGYLADQFSLEMIASGGLKLLRTKRR